MQFHVYELRKEASRYVLHLKDRLSTDVPGTARCLGQRADMKVEKVELRTMLEAIQAKLSQSTLLTVEGALPVPETADREADDES